MPNQDDTSKKKQNGPAKRPSVNGGRQAKSRPSVKDMQRKGGTRRPDKKPGKADSAREQDAPEREGRAKRSSDAGAVSFKVIRTQDQSHYATGPKSTVGLAGAPRRRSTGFPGNALMDDLSSAQADRDKAAREKNAAAARERERSQAHAAALARSLEQAKAKNNGEGAETAPQAGAQPAPAPVPAGSDAQTTPVPTPAQPAPAQPGGADPATSAQPQTEAPAAASASSGVQQAATSQAAAKLQAAATLQQAAPEPDATAQPATQDESPDEAASRPSVRSRAAKQRANRKPTVRKGASRTKQPAEAEGEQAAGTAAATPKARPSAGTFANKKMVGAAVALVAVIAIALFVAWGRWWHYDDAASMQGEWLSEGTQGTAVVTIDATRINLSADVSYTYELDTTAKTITYQFGEMQGEGRYWFSYDRNTLVILDGQFSATDTFFDDAALWWQNVGNALQSKPASVPTGGNAIELGRYGAAGTTTEGSQASGEASNAGQEAASGEDAAGEDAAAAAQE